MSLKQIVKNTLRAGVFGIVGFGVGYLGFQVGDYMRQSNSQYEKLEEKTSASAFMCYQKDPPKLVSAVVNFNWNRQDVRFKYNSNLNHEEIKTHINESQTETSIVDYERDGIVDQIVDYKLTEECVYDHGEVCRESIDLQNFFERADDYQEHKQKFDTADKDFAQKRAEVKKHLQSKNFNKILTRLLEKHDLR